MRGGEGWAGGLRHGLRGAAASGDGTGAWERCGAAHGSGGGALGAGGASELLRGPGGRRWARGKLAAVGDGPLPLARRCQGVSVNNPMAGVMVNRWGG